MSDKAVEEKQVQNALDDMLEDLDLDERAGEEPAEVEVTEEVAEAAPSHQTFLKQEKTDKPYWYVVYTYSGYENKVMTNLTKTIENHHLNDTILEVKVPQYKTRDSKGKTKDRKLYPGYVMIKMYLTDESWYVVRNTRGVTGFVGPASKPIPLSDIEVRAMGLEDVRVHLDVEVGDQVEIVSERFNGYAGEVIEVDKEKQRVRVRISSEVTDLTIDADFVDVKKVRL